jgi:hypothetical protein
LIGGKTGTEDSNKFTFINDITEFGNDILIVDHLLKSKENKLYTDVCFVVADVDGSSRTIFAHKCILACRNTYFSQFFEKSDDIQKISFDNVSFEVLDSYINFLYSCNLKIEGIFIS